MAEARNSPILRTIPFLIAACLIAFPAQAKYSGGTGEPNNPYQIATTADLIALGESPDDYSKHFILTADIDLDPNLPGRRAFAGAVIGGPLAQAELPVPEVEGDQDTPFTGVLDGNGHDIRNLVIQTSWNSNARAGGAYVGLIAIIGEKGQVKRLGLQSVRIDAGNAEFVGGLAGENRGTILSCYSSGSVTTFGLVGGLVGGQYTGTITSCHSAGSVKGVRVGGLVGLLWTGTVSSCYSTASVEKYHQISDVIGYFEYAGGLVGRSWAATISSCYASGNVTADVLAGGLVGTNDEGTIHACYASGKVAGEHIAGGLVGSNGGNIVSCYATGDVSGRWHVGGLAGRAADGSVATSYSVGKVMGGYTAGGLVGGDDSTWAYLSYWNVETSGLTNSTAGEGRTTAQMMSLATFAGWGHDAQWVLEEGKDYPHLVWEGRPGLPLTEPPRTYSGGSGDPNGPYLVKTVDDLICLGESPGDWGASFALVSDIDLTSIPPAGLLRIGTLALPFTGTFDGRGHTVRGLRIEATPGSYSSVVGLFGRIGPSGAVRHVHLAEIVIAGEDCVGGLVGSNEGYVLACSVTGDVSASGTVGGVAGENGGTVVSSCATCSVRGSRLVGGLVGGNHGVISSCYATGTVEGSDYVGGLAGWNSGGVAKCYSAGVGQGQRYIVGGLVGRNDPDHGTVAGCFWDMNTWGPTWDDLGIGRTTTEMQTAAMFLDAGWDFVGETANGTEDIWKIAEGLGYPRLWWEKGDGADPKANYRAGYSGGTGEPNDPYQIATAADLIALGETPADYGKHFVLTADIDLDPNLPGRRFFGMAVIAPDVNNADYGFNGTNFTGTFDGRAHTISGLTIAGNTYLGLFGQLGPEAKIRNLGVVDVNITEPSAPAGYSVGGLAGKNYGSIAMSYSTGTIRAGSYVGGLVGHNRGEITACHSEGTVSGNSDIGGLVGCNEMDATITQCVSAVVVSGTEEQIGGLVGHNWGHITTSNSEGTVSGGSTVGGLIGCNDEDGAVTQCFSVGAVSGEDYVGGLIGQNGGDVRLCFSTGAVHGHFYVGGLLGANRSYTSWGDSRRAAVINCYCTGAVTGDSVVGGLVGDDERNVVDCCYSIGAVSGKGDSSVRGLTGTDGDMITRSFWDMDTSGHIDDLGDEGRTTAQMQDPNTFLNAGWDFVGESENARFETWRMPAGGGYPVLSAFQGYGPPEPNGNGTVETPYLLETPRDLTLLWYRPMACYRLVSDIDLAGSTWVVPVVPTFSGTLDGQGHHIAHADISAEDRECIGFFGVLTEDAVVCDLGLEDVNVVNRYWYWEQKTEDWPQGVGSLVGENSGTIRHCHATGSVSGNSFVGGLAGRATDSSRIIMSCSSTTVRSTRWGTGGLVGVNSGTVAQCYSDGDVNSTGFSAGGLVGRNSDTVTDSYSTGAVTADYYVGGLLGYDNMGFISNCYAAGPVKALAFPVGGLVSAPSSDSWSITASFWDTQTSGQTTSYGGTGKTTVEMQRARTFLDASWDFVGETINGTEDIWWIDEGKGYPRLAWEAARDGGF